MGFLQRFLGNAVDKQIRSYFKVLARMYFANSPIRQVRTIFGFFSRDTAEQEYRVGKIFDLAAGEGFNGPSNKLAREIAVGYAMRFADQAPYVAVLCVYDVLNKLVNEKILADDDTIRELHERALEDIETSQDGRHIRARELLLAS